VVVTEYAGDELRRAGNMPKDIMANTSLTCHHIPNIHYRQISFTNHHCNMRIPIVYKLLRWYGHIERMHIGTLSKFIKER